jgi:adenylate cyclase
MMCIFISAGIGQAGILYILEGGRILGIPAVLLFKIPGVVILLMYNFVFFRLLFVPSLFAGIVIIAVHQEAIWYSWPTQLIIIENWWFIVTLISGATAAYFLESLFRTQFLTNRQLDLERMRSDGLIETLFPARIAERLKARETVIAESHGEASVLFSDLVGFTSLTKKLSPGQLIDILSDYFTILDRLTEKHAVEKIKTIGDAYMVVSGLSDEGQSTTEHIADFALEMMRSIKEYAEQHDFPLALRVGISTGQVISGVIGLKKPLFDLWGETVNLARRMESHSEPGHVQVSESTYWRLREKYEFVPRGRIEVKGVGAVETYFLLGRKSDVRQLTSESARAACGDDTAPVVARLGEPSDAGAAAEQDR